jgi:hypothetical protein
VDALLASVALYPDQLLAKVLTAATYPLEVDEAAHWLQRNKSLTGGAFERAIAAQRWDDSVTDLMRVPGVLSMMADRLEWTQDLGDALLAQQNDVLAAIQRLRAMARNAQTLHSTAQQKVFDRRNTIVIEPAVPQVVNVPYYDPRVAYGKWPHAAYPPLSWTSPRGYAYGPGIGFMAGVAVSAGFWRNGFDWKSKTLYVDNSVTFGNFDRARGTSWSHDPEHRRYVTYSTYELRTRYHRSFTPGEDAKWAFRGYDLNETSPPARSTAVAHGRNTGNRQASHDETPGRHIFVFEGLGDGALVRLFSTRGNASMLAAARDNNAHIASRDNRVATGAREARLTAPVPGR